jgi:glycosyltransferase involved in cell wall biosynthesis
MAGKILYISYARSGRGDEVHTRQFTAAARRLHASLVVHTPRISEDAYSIEALTKTGRRGGDPFREMRYLGGLFIRKAGEQARLLRREKPDVVVMRACRYLSMIWLCRLLKIPLLLEVNAPMWERTLLDRNERFRCMPFWCWLEARLFALADHLAVVSEPLRRYYVDRGLGPGRISVVPNGVDLDAFNSGKNGTELRQAHGLTGKIVIGFVGSFTPWHGLDFLAGAIQTCIAQEPGLRSRIALLLVGRQSSHTDVSHLGGVHTVLTGKVAHAQIPGYLAAMDIIVAPYPPIHPFYFSPLKVFEGMAMGKPVLAPQQGQIVDLIRHGYNGMLYPPGDHREFVRHIARLIEDASLRAELGRNAYGTIAERYTWQNNAASVLKICRQLSYQKADRG